MFCSPGVGEVDRGATRHSRHVKVTAGVKLPTRDPHENGQNAVVELRGVLETGV